MKICIKCNKQYKTTGNNQKVCFNCRSFKCIVCKKDCISRQYVKRGRKTCSMRCRNIYSSKNLNKGTFQKGIIKNCQFKKGYIPWNKGKNQWGTWVNCSACGKRIRVENFRLKRSKNLFCSYKCAGKFLGFRQLGKILPRETIRKMLKRRYKSGLEIKLEKIIQKYNLPYKFVGNGKFFIENINPDFVNTNGEKKALEVYSKTHKNEFREGGEEGWKKRRLEICKKYGWEMIFIEMRTINEANILDYLRGGEK